MQIATVLYVDSRTIWTHPQWKNTGQFRIHCIFNEEFPKHPKRPQKIVWKSDLWSRFYITINLLPTSLLSEKKRCRAHGGSGKKVEYFWISPTWINQWFYSLWLRFVVCYPKKTPKYSNPFKKIREFPGLTHWLINKKLWVDQRSFQFCAAILFYDCPGVVRNGVIREWFGAVGVSKNGTLLGS